MIVDNLNELNVDNISLDIISERYSKIFKEYKFTWGTGFTPDKSQIKTAILKLIENCKDVQEKNKTDYSLIESGRLAVSLRKGDSYYVVEVFFTNIEDGLILEK